MAILTEELKLTAHYLVSEAHGYRSRETIVIASGAGVLKPGTVLGQVKAALEASSAAKAGGNTGNGTFVLDATTPVLAAAKAGVYTLRFTSVTNIRLEDPDGKVLADIPIVSSESETAAVNEQVKGEVTQGSTPFIAGDGFDVTVVEDDDAVAIGKYKPYDPTASDGSEKAKAILYEGCDATSADVRRTITARDSEVHAAVLEWGAGVTTDQHKTAALADLAAFGIIAR